jgi:murein DD-endopeptidase MepM/ murein hydrolase activator NlpD
VHLRTNGQLRSFHLTTRLQAAAALGTVLVLGWTVLATLSFVVSLSGGMTAQTAVAETKAYYQRVLADREARMSQATHKILGAANSLDDLARSVTQRHAALVLLLAHLQPGGRRPPEAPPAGQMRPNAAIEAIANVKRDQDKLLSDADAYANGRADRMRLALRLAGLKPGDPAGAPKAQPASGGPLIALDDPKALAQVLDVDEAFARRVAAAAENIERLKRLDDSVARAPLGQPVPHLEPTSSYGVRQDPITGRGAFHPGQDFGGAANTPVSATAKGTVSFTGERTGYGQVVEVSHDDGFMTRYAHLAHIGVRPGQAVRAGDVVGAMGSTGRSTGVHLHYEVWRNGRLQDPTRFIKAGQYVQEKRS